MTVPKTLMALSGANMAPPALKDTVVVLIDCQQEYVDGFLPLPNARPALDEVARLLVKARQEGAEIIHIAHKGQPGGLFDRSEGGKGAFAKEALPIGSEVVVEKELPNAFAHTDLQDILQKGGRRELVLAGFMTHMCVSSTARAALDLGYKTTIVTEACATRDLPGVDVGVVSADLLHAVSLAGLADRFSLLVPTADTFK